MAKYKRSSFPCTNKDNYLLHLIGLRCMGSRLLTHEEMYQSRVKMELAIPNPA